jgi:hypothetical protein
VTVAEEVGEGPRLHLYIPHQLPNLVLCKLHCCSVTYLAPRTALSSMTISGFPVDIDIDIDIDREFKWETSGQRPA